MARGGGNVRRRDYVGRNNSTTQGSNNTIAPENDPLSSPMDVGLGDTPPNTPSNANEYTSESSQRLVVGSNSTQQNGSTTTQHTPARSLHKTLLIPLGNVFNVQGVPGAVREILMGMFNGNWPTWKKVPKVNQDLMWERFQSKFQWDPEHETKVKSNWEGILKARFRDLMRDAREDAIKLATENGVIVGDDWSVLKPYHPDWIDERNWSAMIDDCWNTESWKQKSAKNKTNRTTLIEGKMAGHSGGSRSMIHTQVFMEKQKGGPVSFIEVYESYFTKRKKQPTDPLEFTTPKAENVWGEYKRLLVEEFGPNSADQPTHIVSTLWEKACGGMKKGKLFGATNDILDIAGETLNNCSPHGSYKAGPSNEEVETLKEEVKRQKREAEKAEKEAEELKAKVAELQEREKARELEMISLRDREKTRELKMTSLEDQMKVFTKFMQSQEATI